MAVDLPRKSIFLAVDPQWDFIDGTLGRPGNQVYIQRLVEQAKKVDVAYVSLDWHPPDHCSFSQDPKFVDGSWPVHAVRFTRGAALPDSISYIAADFILKGTRSDRDAYSLFEGQGIQVGRFPLILPKYATKRPYDVRIGGYVKEKCVRSTVIDALTRFEKVTVIEACCASLDPNQDTFSELEAMGAIIE